MPGNKRLARSYDTDRAGGILTEPMAKTVFCNNFNVALDMVVVTPHGGGEHAAAVVPATTLTVWAENLRVVREDDVATCGHVVKPGSPDTFVGD